MLASSQILNNLKNNGYNWLPDYKDILTKIWTRIEVFFNEDETVLSALWSSFKRNKTQYIGIIFITTKRCFTLECEENNINVKYTPLQMYNLEKIKVQFSKEKNSLNYVSLVNDAFDNGTTFACPNRQVVTHFIETLRGIINGEVEILPDSDNPLLAENEKEQFIDENLKKANQQVEHKIQKKYDKFEDTKKIKEKPDKSFNQKKIKEKPIKFKKAKEEKVDEYANKWKSKLWIMWFLLPLIIFVIIIVVIILL